VRLNIGCGQHYADGWTNTDLHEAGPFPDVVCSILSLPFPDGSVERVYCGHVLEHVTVDDLLPALAEVRRVLANDGKLMIVGPDVNLTALHEPVLLEAVAAGGGRWPGDEHRWIPTGELTLGYLEASGLFDARLLFVADVSDEWPIVAREPWQFAIEAQPNKEPAWCTN
jgi:predicted SAM-dependent methyltransferase